MSTSMFATLKKVERLSDDKLCCEASRLVKLSNRTTAELIAHLAVIDQRKAFRSTDSARPKYSSTWAYCLEGLGLSEPQAHTRLAVARVCQRFPSLLDAIHASRMTLTVAYKLAPHLTEQNATELIQACEGMTKTQVEEFLVELKPKGEVCSGIRRTKAPDRSSSSSAEGRPQNESRGAEENSKEATHAIEVPISEPRRGAVEPVRRGRFNDRFAASDSFQEKLARLAELVGVHNPGANLAELFEMAMDCGLDKKDPQRKLERRRKRAAQKAAKAQAGAAVRVEQGPGEVQASGGTRRQVLAVE